MITHIFKGVSFVSGRGVGDGVVDGVDGGVVNSGGVVRGVRLGVGVGAVGCSVPHPTLTPLC